MLLLHRRVIQRDHMIAELNHRFTSNLVSIEEYLVIMFLDWLFCNLRNNTNLFLVGELRVGKMRHPITVSSLSHTCHVHCFVFAYVKFAHEFLTLFERLVQLLFNFPSWFHTIWFYCSRAFRSFHSQITLCFWSKDMIRAFTCLPSYRYSSFTLWAYLCWGHTYSLTANDRTCKECFS